MLYLRVVDIHMPSIGVSKSLDTDQYFGFPDLGPKHFGAQWFSGRVLDSRPRGRGFEPHRHHCIVVLEQDTFILA